jgi:hypothetical protein
MSTERCDHAPRRGLQIAAFIGDAADDDLASILQAEEVIMGILAHEGLQPDAEPILCNVLAWLRIRYFVRSTKEKNNA